LALVPLSYKQKNGPAGNSRNLSPNLTFIHQIFFIYFPFIFAEHSTVGLAQAWDQLDQLAMRMQHNLEQQIQARNQSGVSEEALREFSMMFRHFDKEKLGRLDHQQFKSCLRALGYDLPMVDEGQPEPEFQRILDVVDPNR
jgi:spectrin alpha